MKKLILGMLVGLATIQAKADYTVILCGRKVTSSHVIDYTKTGYDGLQQQKWFGQVVLSSLVNPEDHSEICVVDAKHGTSAAVITSGGGKIISAVIASSYPNGL